MSLQTLKRSNSLDKLLNAVKEESAPQEKKSYVDERLWKPELDKAGNGYAVIRFLPAIEGEDMPWAKIWNHAFQGPTRQWYIENSLTTVGQKDPVSEHNTRLWNTCLESDKEIARKQKRKLQYYSNIYKGTKNYKGPLKKESKWKVEVQQEKMKVIFNEFKDTKFIWAEPKHDTENFTFNNLTYETYDKIY